jgi:hypothetical protein
MKMKHCDSTGGTSKEWKDFRNENRELATSGLTSVTRNLQKHD